ncbi:maintenance of telomere capping protein 1 [Lipomyces oligophaga]|uniref:maintenance of telomere capping protein 1 n=1 Tax=Lipomyces oligophaga TaxID=45792 RepID=UPI0034CD1517
MVSTDKSPEDGEDVMDLLESLGPDAPSEGAATPVPGARELSTAEPSEKELLGFLDSLEKETASTPVKQIQATPTSSSESSPVVVTSADVIGIPSEAADIAERAETEQAEALDVSASAKDAVSSLSSWFGSTGIWDTASAALKGAEAKVRDIHQNADPASLENAVKGNIGKINTFGTYMFILYLFTEERYMRYLIGEEWEAEVHQMLIFSGFSQTLKTTLTSVLKTIAPPIMRHEQLRIHIFHDIVGYPAIDSIAYSVFDRVMQQVEGGELIIVQKGRESKRHDSDKKGVKRDMGLFTGDLAAAEKLCKANVEQIRRKGKEVETMDDSPIRKSDIYLSIQACAMEKSKLESTSAPTSSSEIKQFCFIVYLEDLIHDLTFISHSQAFPLQWCEWLDSDEPIPGQVDPREWLAEWVEEGLGLAIGVVAQQYVASRMAIGIDLSEVIQQSE